MGRVVVDLAGYTFYEVNPSSSTPYNPIHSGASKTEDFSSTTVGIRALDVCASGYAVRFQLYRGSTYGYGDWISVSAGQAYSCPASGVTKVRLMNENTDGSHDGIYQVVGWY